VCRNAMMLGMNQRRFPRVLPGLRRQTDSIFPSEKRR
jgi:hypothetical protein